MNEFYAQLERQLVEAGARRAVRSRVSLVPARRGRALLAVTTVAAAVAATVAFVPGLRTGSSSDRGAGAAPPAPPAASLPAPSLRGIGVAVLNATTTTGLGRHVGALLERREATLYSIGTDPAQQLARSVVAHRPGAVAQARLVADMLGVRNVRALSPTLSVAVPADADVLVRLGADYRTP